MKNITKADIIDFLKKEVSTECAIPCEHVDVNTAFIDFRMDSLKAVFIMDRLEKFIGMELSPLYIWDHPTIASLSAFVSEEIMEG
jgi:acyl carrier protein